MGTLDLVAIVTQGDRRRRVLTVPVWSAALAVGSAVAVLAALGVRYAGGDGGRWLDELGLVLGRRWFPVPRDVALTLVGLFDAVPLAVMITVLAGVCLALRGRRLAVVAVVGPVLTGVVGVALKELVDRTKNGDLSYPSGHMGSAVAVALVVALLLTSVIDMPRWLAAATMVVVPAVGGGAVGLAMTVTNYHYLTDAIGGACVAVAVVLGAALVVDRWWPDHAGRTAGAGESKNVASTG